MNGGGLVRWPPDRPVPEPAHVPAGIKNSVAAGDTLTIEDGYQYICFGEFIHNGDLVIDGELVVLD